MPTFVTDATVLVPGLLDPWSRECKLLTLCAYGRLRYYEAFGAEEVNTTPEVRGGLTVYGRPVYELQREAGARAAALAEHLPLSARDDCLLALSTPILDALERVLESRRIGSPLGMTAELSVRLRQTAATLAAHAPTISLAQLPRVTGTRELDLVLETAARARVGFVVSDSPQAEHLYGRDLQLEGGTPGGIRVCSFESFLMYSELEGLVDEIEGSLLNFAVALQDSS